MQKKSPKIYCFVNDFNLSELSKLSKDISIIYRNYNNDNHIEKIIKLKQFCKKSRNEIYLSNDIKLAVKLGLNGAYVPSFNKKINYTQVYRLPKKFKIIGSAHSYTEVILKKKTKVQRSFFITNF